jgi:uncharacterized protein (TIGR02996 family)
MTDLGALLAAIAADPADDTVRLAYADYLEENGDELRAEFVRLQVELASRNPGDPANRPLVVRNLQLLRDHVPRWRAELPHLIGIEWGDFNRGLIEEVEADTEWGITQHAEVIFAQPAVHVVRLAHLFHGGSLARVSRLERVRKIRIIGARAADAALRHLLASPHLHHLIVLDLDGNRAGDRTAEEIADGRFPNLEELWLGANRIGNSGARVLATSKHLAKLRLLDLRGNAVHDLEARAALVKRFGRGVRL